jgi:hypothetical protein
MSRQTRSKKRSAANSTAARRPEQAEFYLDESIYSRVLIERIRGLGATVHHPGESLPFGSPDEAWLAECGARGWIVLSRDKAVRRRPLEMESLRTARVAAFICTAGQATARQTADTVERILGKLVNISRSQARPFVYTFGLSGKPVRLRLRRGR